MSSPRCAVSDSYRRGWALACSLLSACGVLAASVEWSTPAVIAGLLLDTVLVAVCLSALHAMLDTSDPTPHPDRIRLLRRSSSCVCAVVAVAAVAIISPGLAALVTTGLLVSSPRVLDLLLRRVPQVHADDGTDGQDRMHV